MAVERQSSAEYLKILFWLKWKLLLRGYRKSMSAILGVILALAVFLPIAVGVAFAIGVAFFNLPTEWQPHLLRAVLLAIYLWWLVVPLLGYALNESYDITKLFVFPLSVRQIFTGAILGSFLDFPLLFVIPTLIAIVIGFTHGAIGLLAVVIPLILFMFHTLSLSQGLILASAGILRSRRFRDIAMVVVPLLWIGYYIFSQSLSRQAMQVDWRAFVKSTGWEIVNYLPPGLAARGIYAAGQGKYLDALVYLLALAVVSAATIYAAGWVIQKVFEGETVGFSAKKKTAPAASTPVTRGRAASRPESGGLAPTKASAAADSRRPSLFDRLPAAVQAVAAKEFKYFFRDPYFRITMMNLGYMLVVAVFIFIRPQGRHAFENFGPGMAWGASGMVMLSEMQMVCNIFGTEGGAALILFQFPVRRRYMLMGKNLAFFTGLSVVNVAFMVIISSLAGALAMFGPLVCWMTLALVIFISMGNIVSVQFPFRIVMKGWRVRQQAAGRSCSYSFLYLAFFFAASALLIPILAALLLPSFFVSGIWFILTVPLAIGYAVLMYYLSLRICEPLILKREIEMMQKLAAEE